MKGNGDPRQWMSGVTQLHMAPALVENIKTGSEKRPQHLFRRQGRHFAHTFLERDG